MDNVSDDEEYVMLEMDDSWPNAEQFLTMEANGRLRINNDTIAKLEEIKKPLSVVCLSYFWKKMDGDNIGCCTTPLKDKNGLWIQYIANHKNTSKGILVVESADNNLQILKMCLILSNLFTFNFKMDVGVVKMEDLKFVVRLRQDVTEIMKSHLGDNWPSFCPIFVQNEAISLLGQEIHGELVNDVDYTEHHLIKSEEDKVLLQRCFPERKYFILPLEFIDPHQILQQKHCDGCDFILNDEHCRTPDGQSFVSMAKTYIDIVHKCEIQNVKIELQTITESLKESLLRQNCKLYRKPMTTELQFPSDPTKFSRCHGYHSNTALAKLIQVLPRHESKEYYWSAFWQFEERIIDSYMDIQEKHKALFVPSSAHLQDFYQLLLTKVKEKKIKDVTTLKQLQQYCSKTFRWWENKYLKQSVLQYLDDLLLEEITLEKTLKDHVNKFNECIKSKNDDLNTQPQFAPAITTPSEELSEIIPVEHTTSKKLMDTNQQLLKQKQMCLENTAKNSNDWNGPIQLLTPDSRNKLHVNQEAIHKLEKIDKPFAVISISGPHCLNNTKLINKIIKHSGAARLDKPAGGEATKGIWAWYIENKSILLLDTQRFSQEDTTFAILCLSALMSSVFILYTRAEEHTALIKKLIADLHKYTNGQSSAELQAKFVLLIDFAGRANTITDLSAKRMFFGSDENSETLIQDFSHYFSKQKYLAKMENQDDFIHFYESVVSTAPIKKINRTYDINGRRFVNLIQQYNDLLQTDACGSNFHEIDRNIAQCENEIVYKKSVEIYHTLMLEKLIVEPSLKTYAEFHEDFSKRAIEVFLKDFMDDKKFEWGRKLLEEMHNSYMTLLMTHKFSLNLAESKIFLELHKDSRPTVDLQGVQMSGDVSSCKTAEPATVNKCRTLLGDMVKEEQNLQAIHNKNIGRMTTEYRRHQITIPEQCRDMIQMNGVICREVCSTCLVCERVTVQSWPEPLQLLTPDVDNHLSINQETVAKLKTIDMPFVVVTVAGLYRTGKSYLLNRIARKTIGYSPKPLTGFKVSASSELETKGIWIWFMKYPTTENKGLLLLDTHGLGDPETNDAEYDQRVMCISALLSSVLIFNFRGDIDVTTIEKLIFVKKLQSLRANFACPAPDFVLVVRDSQFEIEINDEEVSEDKYMEHKMFQCNETYPNAHNDLVNVFTKYFVNRKCFTMSMPANGKGIRHLDSLPDEKLESDFLKEFNKFYDHVLKTPPVKKIDGKKFVDLLKTSFDLIRNKSTSIRDLSTLVVDKRQMILTECKEEYQKLLNENLICKSDLKMWLDCHQICCKIVTEKFLLKNVVDEEDLNQYKLLMEYFLDSCVLYAKAHFATYLEQTHEGYFSHKSTIFRYVNTLVQILKWFFTSRGTSTTNSKDVLTELRQRVDRNIQNFDDNLVKQRILRFFNDITRVENAVQRTNQMLAHLLMEAHERWKTELDSQLKKTDHKSCGNGDCNHQIVSNIEKKLINFEKEVVSKMTAQYTGKIFDQVFYDSEILGSS